MPRLALGIRYQSLEVSPGSGGLSTELHQVAYVEFVMLAYFGQPGAFGIEERDFNINKSGPLILDI